MGDRCYCWGKVLAKDWTRFKEICDISDDEELARVVNAGPVADGWVLGRRHVLAVLAEKEKE